MPTVTYRTTTETKSVPFTNTNINDNSLPQGQTQITTAGVNGTETLTYKITYTNGQQTDKQLVSDAVTTPPINQTTQIGTYVAPAVTAPASTDATTTSCHPLTNGGNCYEPGEYCRASDHGLTGLAGDGKVIVCADNDGWRWEPN